MAAFISKQSFDKGDEDAAAKMSEVFGPGQIDQMIRQGIHFCWMALPKSHKNADELDRQIKRIVDRALKDFRDDVEQFNRMK